MSNLTIFIRELADACVCDDCGYDPLPQHVTVFLNHIRGMERYQEALADYLQDADLWRLFASEILHGTNDDKDAVWFTINRVTREWATSVLTLEVENVIEAKLAGHIPDEVEFTDEFGGAL